MKLHSIVGWWCLLVGVVASGSHEEHACATGHVSSSSSEECAVSLSLDCTCYPDECHEVEEAGYNVTKVEECPVHEEHSTAYTAILFPWFAQLLGILSMHFMSRYTPELPYTAILFVEGVILGVINEFAGDWSQLGESINIWKDIDPHLLLFAFLPALLFGDAFEVNWFLFKKAFGQILWIAFPAMLMGAALTALLAYYILDGWDVYLCLTFGSILAATDPVAVVALLKEVGAPPSLTMLISGESMLNDGAAIVMYTIFSNKYRYGLGSTGAIDFDVAGGFAIFFQMSLGGAALGILFGVFAIMWLSFLNRKLEETDTIMQLSLTLTVAYLSYYFAEAVCSTSGVLAVVFCGIFIAAFAKPLITAPETLEHVWKSVEHLGNTLLFVLGGVVWGSIVADQDSRQGHITSKDWGLLFAIYILVIIVRGVVLVSSQPLVSRIGLHASWADVVFMVWGGLRGAVGIALALSLDQEIRLEFPDDNNAQQQTSQVIFYVGGIALLTLVVNGTSSNALLRKLGLTGTTEARKCVLNAVHSKMIHVARDTFESTIDNKEYCHVDRSMVFELVPCLKKDSDLDGNGPVGDDVEQQQDGKGQPKGRPRGDLVDKMKPNHVSLEGFSSESKKKLDKLVQRKASSVEYQHAVRFQKVVVTMRELFIDLLRAAYWEQIREGMLREDSVAAYMLLQSCDMTAREVTQNGMQLCDWVAVKNSSNSLEYRIDRTINWAMGKAKWANRHDVQYKQEQLRVHMSISFVKAHEKAQHELETYFDKLDAKMGGSLDNSSREDQVVISESRLEVLKARKVLESSDKALVQSTVNKMVAAIVLDAQGKYIREAKEAGTIQEKEAQVMFHEVTSQLAMLHWANVHKLKTDPSSIKTSNIGWCEHVIQASGVAQRRESDLATVPEGEVLTVEKENAHDLSDIVLISDEPRKEDAQETEVDSVDTNSGEDNLSGSEDHPDGMTTSDSDLAMA